jgi:hypothetical protein
VARHRQTGTLDNRVAHMLATRQAAAREILAAVAFSVRAAGGGGR